ncbi:MAG: PTS sugar transporter subunit IIA [Longicatena caecimuris]
MIFLIGVPENKRTKEHLQILAWLSRNLMHQEFREDILHAENEQQLFNCLKKLETEKGD